MLDVIDKCPTCGSERKRQVTNEKVLICWADDREGLIIEYTKGGTLEQQIKKLKSYWVQDLFPDLENYPEGKTLIWEGRIVVDNDNGDSHTTKGKFRQLTENEWTSLREGLPLFGEKTNGTK